MKKIHFFIVTLAILMASCKSQYTDLGDGIFADIQTNKGDIVVKLYYKATPLTVANFVSLAEGSNPFVVDSLKERKYYDGVIFHRVIKDFMIQGGDPSGTGGGSPGYKFADEFVDSLVHDRPGILSMANAGPGTNGSQFFITHKPTMHLNGRHTVFGEVVKGLEVVDSIANVATSTDFPKDKPLSDIIMNHVVIVRNGKDAKTFDAVRIMSDYFEGERKKQEAYKKMLSDFSETAAKQKEEAQTLDSGLKLYYLKKAENGEKPKTGQKVWVNYAGYFSDGKLFDSNSEEIETAHNKLNPIKKQRGLYKPVAMDYSPDAALIPGFREGLLQMRVGEKIRVFVPPHLGYGESQYGPIPPNSHLVFDIELTGIQH